MRTLRPLAPLLAAGLLSFALAACGQKGPLYLPDATPPPATRQHEPAPAPTTTPEKPKQGDGSTHDGGPHR